MFSLFFIFRPKGAIASSASSWKSLFYLLSNVIKYQRNRESRSVVATRGLGQGFLLHFSNFYKISNIYQMLSKISFSFSDRGERSAGRPPLGNLFYDKSLFLHFIFTIFSFYRIIILPTFHLLFFHFNYSIFI